MMGQLAATDDYDPFERAAARLRQPYSHFPGRESNIPKIPGAVIGSVLNTVRQPGAIMAENPYPEGSEQASFFEDQRRRNMDAFGREMALNTLGTGVIAGVPIRAGETLLGAGAVRGKPGAGEAQYARYAEEYPAVGPPEVKFDKKKKQEYLSKQLTPEAEAFQAERARIMRDMEKNGYTPYFDVSKRFHVDPKNYPSNVDTTAIVPSRQATIDKYMGEKELGDPAVRERLRAAFQRGTEMPNTADWYALGQLEKEFVKELGAKEGRKAFQDRIATSMAATTGGADPTSNWLMAHYGNYLRNKNMPYPQTSYEMPFPVGGRYGTSNTDMHKKIFDEGGFSFLGEANPKRHNFSQNFTGNRGAATMDEQMTGLMTPGRTMPPPGTYGLYERVLAEEAKKAGVMPQNYQDVAWSGAKNLKDPSYKAGEPFIQTINESIERTHRLTGMPREEILRRGVIKSEIPMYSVTGVPGLSAIADQSTYAQ